MDSLWSRRVHEMKSLIRPYSTYKNKGTINRILPDTLFPFRKRKVFTVWLEKIFETLQKVIVYDLKSFKTSTCFNTSKPAWHLLMEVLLLALFLLEDHGKIFYFIFLIFLKNMYKTIISTLYIGMTYNLKAELE